MPSITCKAEFGVTDTLATMIAPFATTSGGAGNLMITSDPPGRISDTAFSVTVGTPQVVVVGIFTVVDEAGSVSTCTSTLTIVEGEDNSDNFVLFFIILSSGENGEKL